MLSDNIKILRKKKGYSQETLAELFEVPVSVLLGGGLEVEEEQPSELNEIAQQLAVLNDQQIGRAHV